MDAAKGPGAADSTPDPGGAPRLAIALAALNIPVMAFAQAQAAPARPKEPLHEVVVSAKRMYYNGANDLALDKLTQSVVDTPQTIAAVSANALSDRAVNDLNGALRAVPGITLGAGESNWQGNNPYLRGFPARDDLFVDGQRDFGSYYRDPFDDAQVVVLEGPASILFGHGSTGGVINQVSKSPRLTPLLAGAATLGTNDLQRVTVDTGAPLARLGPGAAFRLNLMANHNGVADRDVVHGDRWGIAPSLALGLGTPTRLEIKYFHQTNREVPDLGIPWLNGRPAPVRRANFYGFTSDYLDTAVDILTARLEHDFSGSTTLSTQLRYSTDSRRYRMTEADIPKGVAPNTPVDAITVARNAFPAFQGSGSSTFWDDQTDLTMRLSSGPIKHAIVAGFELGREAPHTTYYNDIGVPGTNLANPVLQAYSVAASYPEMSTHTVAKTAGVYALDTLQWGAWQVMGGGREDLFDAPYRSVKYSSSGAVLAQTTADQVNRIFSYRAALVYKPAPNGSVYAMTGTSFDPSAEGIASLISAGRTLAQANLNLGPERTKTYEIGSKWRLPDGGLLITGAVFRMEMANARVPDPNNPEFAVLGGDERVDGAQLSASGQLTHALRIDASYTYLDSVVVRTTPKGPLLGAPLTNAPRNSSSIWIKYRIARPLEIGIGGLQASSQLGQDTAAAYLVAPGYVVWNAMAKYRATPHLVVRLNLDNIANRAYIAQVHPFHVIPAEGFAARLSVAVRY
ncbi:MAG: TonB-dependent receptor [Gammaproteobacteria bacterium]|nr:TonB-dependent receptor [Gammaproteobacteria bacterium]